MEVNRSVGEVSESMQPLVDIAGVGLNIQLTTNHPFIEGDVFALGRASHPEPRFNRIDGAILTVSIGEYDRRIRIYLHDTGTKIPRNRLDNILKDFQNTTRRWRGLELAISSKIVNQLGGDIIVAITVGHGTTFSLEFGQV
jgi:signal transduction histidine kinase